MKYDNELSLIELELLNELEAVHGWEPLDDKMKRNVIYACRAYNYKLMLSKYGISSKLI